MASNPLPSELPDLPPYPQNRTLSAEIALCIHLLDGHLPRERIAAVLGLDVLYVQLTLDHGLFPTAVPDYTAVAERRGLLEPHRPLGWSVKVGSPPPDQREALLAAVRSIGTHDSTILAQSPAQSPALDTIEAARTCVATLDPVAQGHLLQATIEALPDYGPALSRGLTTRNEAALVIARELMPRAAQKARELFGPSADIQVREWTDHSCCGTTNLILDVRNIPATEYDAAWDALVEPFAEIMQPVRSYVGFDITPVYAEPACLGDCPDCLAGATDPYPPEPEDDEPCAGDPRDGW